MSWNAGSGERSSGTRGTRRHARKSVVLYGVFWLLFLLAYLGLYIHPALVWWLQLIAPLVPLLSVLALAISFVVLRATRPSVRIAHVVLIVLILIRFAPAVPGLARAGWDLVAGGPAGASDALVVLVHNAKWNPPETEDATRKYLARVNPHVVAYQEASVRFLDRGTGYSEEVVPAMRLGYRMPPLSGDSQRRVNQPVMTTLPADTFAEYSLSEPGTRGTSDVSRAVIRWQETDIAIYNVHLRSYLRWGAPWAAGDGAFRRFVLLVSAIRTDVLARAKEAEALQAMTDRERLPYILGGDLNATRHNWEYRFLRRGRIDATRRGGVLFPGTFPAILPLLQLDHILASSDWRVMDASVGPKLASDHRPVIATLALRNGRAGRVEAGTEGNE